MERLGGDVRGELARLGPAGAMLDVAGVWAASVGPAIAANTSPARLTRDGTLVVNASSATWAFELGHLAPEILARLVAALGAPAPRALRFVPGHVPEPARDESLARLPSPVVPGAAERRRAEELAAAITSDSLRETVARTVALSLASAAADRCV
jgi:hypothetical protein